MFPTYQLPLSLALHLLSARSVAANQDISCTPNLVNEKALGSYNIPPFTGPPLNRTVSPTWTITTNIWKNETRLDRIFYLDTHTDDLVNNPKSSIRGCAVAIRSLPTAIENSGKSNYNGGACSGLLDPACINAITSAAKTTMTSLVSSNASNWDCTEALATVPPECEQYTASTDYTWVTSQAGDLFNLPNASSNNRTCQSPSGNGNAFLEIVYDSATASVNATANRITPILLAAWSNTTKSLWMDTQLVCIGSNEAGPSNPFSTSWAAAQLPVGSFPLTALAFLAIFFGLYM